MSFKLATAITSGLMLDNLPRYNCVPKSVGARTKLHGHEEVIRFGSFSLYPEKRILFQDGEEVNIGDRALALLVVLAKRTGEMVEKDELISLAWPNVVVEEANLRVQIHSLRNILGNKNYIVTVPRRGYRFVADLTQEKIWEKEGLERYSIPNLPVLLFQLFGRDSDIDRVRGLLSHQRLVSLTGMGGVGKTCVAIEVARLLSEDESVLFFDVANIKKNEDIVAYMAQQLNIPGPPADAFNNIVASCSSAPPVFLFDGCESRLEEISPLIEELLGALPQSRVLATSREPLGVSLEVIYRLSSLSTPEKSSIFNNSEGYEYPAIDLFVMKAKAFCNDFTLRDKDTEKIAEICRSLDGNPLAIEIAAGKVTAFGLDELTSLVKSPFCLSMRGRRTAIDRHHTLADNIAWSYEGLTESHKCLLHELTKLPDSFSLCDVREVMAQSGAGMADLHHQVEDLVAKSLLLAYIKENHGCAESNADITVIGSKCYSMSQVVRVFVENMGEI